MTIPSENYRNDYPGDGSNDTFSYTFKITSENDIKVSQRDTEDVETELTLNVDYAVTGVGALNGGTIVLTAGNLTTDYHLTIRRDSDLTQLTDIRNQGDFYPEVHEDTFDKLASVSLTQQSEIDRCVKVSETYPVDVELPGPQAGKVISWNAAGDALINVDPGSVALAEPADSSVTPAKMQSGLAFLFPETFVLKRGSDVASASALPLINDGNYVDVTGTDAITSIDAIGIGTWMLLQFDAALTLTHHATDLFLPNAGSNITTAAGDHALMVEFGVGKWRCAAYIKANGHPVAATLTGMTLTSPAINTSVSGTAFQDDDTFAAAASNKFASSESIKAYIDNQSVLSKSFTSTEKTITAAGALVLVHGLSSVPYLIMPYLICKTAEFGYSVGDQVLINPAGNDPAGNNDKGASIVPDATNINIRYGSFASVFGIIRKDTGAATNITAANWKLIIRAWA